MVEVKRGVTVKPSAFTLANWFNAYDPDCIIDCSFEASNDGTKWTILKTTISSDDISMWWNVECDMFFNFFRILWARTTKEETGPNEDLIGGTDTYELFVKGFEMYGKLQMD